MAATQPSTSLQALDLWGSIGIELMIFAATFFFAVLIKGIKGTSATCQADKQRKAITEVDKLGVEKPAPHNQVLRTGANEVVGACKQRTGHAPNSPQVEKQHQEPWQVVNDVVEGMKEHQGMKFIYRVLSMYDELKASLDSEGLTMPQVARFSRYSAVEFYTALVQCAVRTNKYRRVEEFIDDMVRQGVSRPLMFYESAMKQLAGQKQYQSALAVFDRLAADGMEPSPVTYSCLIGFAAQAGEFQRAVAFFAKLSAASTPSIRAYMTILRVHAKRGDWRSSIATFRDMQCRNVALDSLVLNIVLATGIASNQLEAVAALVEEAENHVPPLPDIVSYNTLMKGCAQQGDVHGATQALGRMRRRGLAPNAISFNTAMDANVRAGRCLDAWKVLEQMRAAGFRPDKFSCSIMIKGVAQTPDSQHIEAGLILLREVGTTCDSALLSSMYHTLLETASQVGDDALVAKVFTQMSRQSVAPSASAQHLLVKILPRSTLMEG